MGQRRSQAEANLVGEDGLPEAALADTPTLEGVVADPDVAHEALLEECSQRCHCRACRHERVGEMHLVEVDRLYPEPPQAAPHLPVDDRWQRQEGLSLIHI